MSRIIEAINSYGTGNGTLTTLAHVADPTQTLQIRSITQGEQVRLGPVWAQMGAAADLSINSPNMHDPVHALQLRVQSGLSTPLSPFEAPQKMLPVDIPTVQSTFSAAPASATAEQAGWCNCYDGIDVAGANLQAYSAIEPNIEHIFGVKVTATSSATAGAYGAQALINSGYDEFKADRVYALLGYDVSAECGNVGIQGPDTGNYTIGGPGAIDPLVTRNWFVKLEDIFGPPAIPVIKANNKGSTGVLVSHTTASTAVIVQLILALLKAGS